MPFKLKQEAKPAYYTNFGSKLSNPVTAQKHLWAVYNKITNKKKYTKNPPIIYWQWRIYF